MKKTIKSGDECGEELLTPIEFTQMTLLRTAYLRGPFLEWIATNYPDEDKFTKKNLEALFNYFCNYV